MGPDARHRTGPLEPFLWKKRPLLIFADAAGDEKLKDQLAAVERDRKGFDERDMALVVVIADGGHAGEEALTGEAAALLRASFEVEDGEFAVILVGKDGTEKLRSNEPVEMARLFEVIDAMPMRRREMRERKGLT